MSEYILVETECKSYIANLSDKKLFVFNTPISIARLSVLADCDDKGECEVKSLYEDLSDLYRFGWDSSKTKLPGDTNSSKYDIIAIYNGCYMEIVYDSKANNVKPMNTALEKEVAGFIEFLRNRKV